MESEHSTKFRVQAPNSSARDILVVPLDALSGRISEEVAQQNWRNARFVPHSVSGEAWRAALAEGNADLVVMIGQVGENLAQAVAVGETCIEKSLKISGVLLRQPESGLAEVSAALRSLRPWTQTLAVIAEVDYLPGLLHALGA